MICDGNQWQKALDSIKQIEIRFNWRINYPYVLLSTEPFTYEFKKELAKYTKANVSFGMIEKQFWKVPSDIDLLKAAESRIELGKVLYADAYSYWYSQEYRQRARYYSGFFFRHPLVSKYEYYWRIEPGTEYLTHIRNDPFIQLQNSQKAYGYNLLVVKDLPAIKSLWNTTKKWTKERPEFKGNPLLAPNTSAPLLNFFTVKYSSDVFKNVADVDYNGCYFWSSFEIARVDLWNNNDYISFFEYLDKSGGFFYERWGDAPIHSLYIALTLSKDKLYNFDEIASSHDGVIHRPNGNELEECNYSKDALIDKVCLNQFASYRDSPYNGFPIR